MPVRVTIVKGMTGEMTVGSMMTTINTSIPEKRKVSSVIFLISIKRNIFKL